MLKTLQLAACLFAIFYNCGITLGDSPNHSTQRWTPTSTQRNVTPLTKAATSATPSTRAILRPLELDAAGNLSAERVEPLPGADETSVDQALSYLKEGTGLLDANQWLEAKKIFEKALRSYPNDIRLQSAFSEARRRHEISIRYKDSSFATLASTASISTLSELFDDVFQNLEQFHVDHPGLAQLYKLGLAGVGDALQEEEFYTQNLISPLIRSQACETFKTFQNDGIYNEIHSMADVKILVWDLARKLKQDANIPETATISEFLCSCVCSLDAYSSALTPMQVEDVFSIIDGRFIGIGVELKTERPTKIIRVIPGSPAEDSGLREGDDLLVINGVSTQGLSSAKIGSLLQGEEGEEVSLLVRKPDGKTQKLLVSRRPIVVPSVEKIHVLETEGEIGYVKISCFQKNTTQELITAINVLYRQHISCLIIDLRQNPGGLLQEAINVSDLFLPGGIIVQTRGRNGYHSFKAQSQNQFKIPLLLLVDSNSASAAEIFAGAMQENNRALVIGESSYGKGTVQAIVQLSSSANQIRPIAGLRITTEKFYSPKGRAYAGVGVTPDIEVSAPVTIQSPSDSSIRIQQSEIVPKYAASVDYSTTSLQSGEQAFGNGYIPKKIARNSEIDDDPYLSRAVAVARRIAEPKGSAR